MPSRARSFADVDPDVADPDHVRTSGDELGRESDRLWVVQHDDVAPLHEGLDRPSFALQRRVVDGALLRPERAAVTRAAVQAVVDALRDLEERRVALDHHPSRVDPGRHHVSEQGVQQLGHAAALGGGVHVPPRAALEAGGGIGERPAIAEQVVVLDQLGEAVGVLRRDRHLVHRSIMQTRGVERVNLGEARGLRWRRGRVRRDRVRGRHGRHGGGGAPRRVRTTACWCSRRVPTTVRSPTADGHPSCSTPARSLSRTTGGTRLARSCRAARSATSARG